MIAVSRRVASASSCSPYRSSSAHVVRRARLRRGPLVHARRCSSAHVVRRARLRRGPLVHARGLGLMVQPVPLQQRARRQGRASALWAPCARAPPRLHGAARTVAAARTWSGARVCAVGPLCTRAASASWCSPYRSSSAHVVRGARLRRGPLVHARGLGLMVQPVPLQQRARRQGRASAPLALCAGSSCEGARDPITGRR